MGRYTGPKHKRSRREGVDLYGNGGESLQRRLDQPPGVHGREHRPGRESDYTKQLREKQKAKRIYGVRERQFRRFYRLAQRAEDLTGASLLSILERRLDNVVYRLGWARTRPQARQFVNHGHILVDGQRVDIPSFLVKPQQTIALKDKIQLNPDVKAALDTRFDSPDWLTVSGNQGQVLRVPHLEDISTEVDPQLIVEFYSR